MPARRGSICFSLASTMALPKSKILQSRRDLFSHGLTEERKFAQKATKDAKRWIENMGGPTPCPSWLRLCRAADSYAAVSIIKRCCPGDTGDDSLHKTDWIVPARVAQICISIFIDSTIATG